MNFGKKKRKLYPQIKEFSKLKYKECKCITTLSLYFRSTFIGSRYK